MAATSCCQGAPGQLFMISLLKIICTYPKHLLSRDPSHRYQRLPLSASRANRQNQPAKFVVEYIIRSRTYYRRAVNTNRCILGRCSVAARSLLGGKMVENPGKVRESKARACNVRKGVLDLRRIYLKTSGFGVSQHRRNLRLSNGYPRFRAPFQIDSRISTSPKTHENLTNHNRA